MATRHPSLAVEQIGDVTVATITERSILDERVTQSLGDELFRLVEHFGHRQLILNFTHVERLTSTMLGKLFGLHKKVQIAHGRLVLCGIRPELSEIFTLINLPKLLPIYGDEQEALQSF